MRLVKHDYANYICANWIIAETNRWPQIFPPHSPLLSIKLPLLCCLFFFSRGIVLVFFFFFFSVGISNSFYLDTYFMRPPDFMHCLFGVAHQIKPVESLHHILLALYTHRRRGKDQTWKRGICYINNNAQLHLAAFIIFFAVGFHSLSYKRRTILFNNLYCFTRPISLE